MFKTRDTKPEEIIVNSQEKEVVEKEVVKKDVFKEVKEQKTNTILKGSKLIGDININYDFELSGEVEGNINSEQNSNIIIKGICKGNIRTKEGNVDIQGELMNGDIIAGGNVKITGKFKGGMVKAKNKISAFGEFSGKLESNEIEIGPNARGKGELFYKEYISISRGARVEAKVNQIHEDRKDEVKKAPEIKAPETKADTKVVNIERPAKEVGIIK
ncbi:MAG: polymer-forming cytoskeletal protein [Thermodesulfovibrionia bacterium]|nr:polymer-forming cytoskeletal protein [Thermodesulfovibrionia bacterium]